MQTDAYIGTVIAGHRIRSELGRGGMSVVYLGVHERLGVTRAIKLLAANLAQSDSFRARFEQEWRLAASLEHPSIVQVFDAGEVEDRLYIVMRYVDGEDLASLLSKGDLGTERTLALLGQIADALDAAHRYGLVHRDVKPQNILVGTDDRAYLTDFGIAKDVERPTALTLPNQYLGTLDYNAPEQIQGSDVDARTDVYSLACVLYECLTGTVPFPRDSETATMMAHITEPPPRPTTRRPDLPPGIDAVITRSMSKDKQARHPSCGELIAAARATLTQTSARTVLRDPMPPPTRDGEAPPPPPPPPPARERWWRSRRVLAAAAAAALVLGAVIAAVLLLTGGEKVAVPSVVSQDRARAEAALENAGFDVSASIVASDEEEGVVVGQHPPAGDKAEKGSDVRLDVSKGPPIVAVPDVVGESQADAEAALEQAGFQVEVAKEPSDKAAEGTVVSLRPAEEAEKGSVIRVGVSDPVSALRAVVPSHIRATCEEGKADEFPTEAIAKLSCRPPNRQAHWVQYNLFATTTQMRQAYNESRDVVERQLGRALPGGDCETDRFARSSWGPLRNAPNKGLVFCYIFRGKRESWIEWTDLTHRVYTWAERDDLSDATLYDWWANRKFSGPFRAQ